MEGESHYVCDSSLFDCGYEKHCSTVETLTLDPMAEANGFFAPNGFVDDAAAVVIVVANGFSDLLPSSLWTAKTLLEVAGLKKGLLSLVAASPLALLNSWVPSEPSLMGPNSGCC